MSYTYQKVPVDMTPGAQLAIMKKDEPGRFLENHDCRFGDLPVVLNSKEAAMKFIADNGIPAQDAVIIGTDDKQYFMVGDNVYLAVPDDARE